MNVTRLLSTIAFATCLLSTAFAQETHSVKEDSQPAFAVHPGVRFLTASSAQLRWETTTPGEHTVAFGPSRKLGRFAKSESEGRSHRVVLDDLQSGRTYWYRFGKRQNGKLVFSPFFQFDAAMNYMPESIQSEDQNETIEAIVAHLRQKSGFAVTVGAIDWDWVESLAAQTMLTVVATSADEAVVQRLRQRWYQQSNYGIRLSARLADTLPKSFANLVIASADEIEQARSMVAKLGQVVSVGGKPDLLDYTWTDLGDGVFIGSQSDAEPLAKWGHQYGSTGNASFSGETLGGIDKASQLAMKWIGRPGADFGIDRNPRMPAPLATGGRLFHQGMNRMIALDAYNGTVLWSLEIPGLRRVNIPRDSANWCADEETVYAAVGDRLWLIDAATGEMKTTFQLPDNDNYSDNDKSNWGYIAVAEETLIATSMKPGSDYDEFWGKASWYDNKDDAATAKVCGQSIIAFEKDYGAVKWQYPADAIVHSTIAIADDHVYFVVVDDPTLASSENGKLQNKQIWAKSSVVCLDIETGQQLWKQPVPKQNDQVIVSFGIADGSQYILETSGDNQFYFSAFDSATGNSRWTRSARWPEDHHGAHMQHAVLMNGKILIQPHVIDAETGEIERSDTLGKRRGCATPVGAGNFVIYRGGTGPLSLWSLKDDQPTEFARLRPSCWLSTIPAQGMLFSPEGGGGCSCGGWMETSIGFAPFVDHDGKEDSQ
ncbi:MAG: PQQ-binding-like beta-propeller repeat protein [Pirellulaceae bacterium]